MYLFTTLTLDISWNPKNPVFQFVPILTLSVWNGQREIKMQWTTVEDCLAFLTSTATASSVNLENCSKLSLESSRIFSLYLLLFHSSLKIYSFLSSFIVSSSFSSSSSSFWSFCPHFSCKSMAWNEHSLVSHELALPRFRICWWFMIFPLLFQCWHHVLHYLVFSYHAISVYW